MTTTREQIDCIAEALGGMYRVLASLREKELPVNPDLYAVMAEGAVEQIRQFNQQLDELAGFSLALERQADLWIRLEGPQKTWSYAPLSVLVACLQTVQTGFQEIAESIASEFSHNGLSPQQFAQRLGRACNFQVIALQSDSLQIGLCLPDAEDLSEQFEEAEWEGPLAVAREALNRFWDAAEWIERIEDARKAGEPLDKMHNPDVRALNVVLALLPEGSAEVEALELSGRRRPVGKPIRLNQRALQQRQAVFLR